MTHIKCILIGGGANSAVGRVHKDALALSKHKWEIIDACFSRDSERHRESVELWNLPECPHESIENILQKHENKSSELVVVILTPTNQHANIYLAVNKGYNDLRKAIVSDEEELELVKKNIQEKGHS